MSAADGKTIDDGGSAFPKTGSYHAEAGGEYDSIDREGMSLREWYAGKAVQAAVAGHISHYGHEDYWRPKDIASYAVEVADAMIAALKGGVE